MKKKILITLTVVCTMLFTLGMINVSAATNGTCGNNLTWTLDDSGTLTISGTGVMDNYIDEFMIPWYSNRMNIKKVVIGTNVTSIGSWAFRDCINLTEIALPKGITSIVSDSFANTGYSNNSNNWENNVLYIDHYLITANENLSGAYCIKENTTVIAETAFSHCENLLSVTLPDSVKKIGGGAFYGCSNLTSINIPYGITSIERLTFYGCSNLTSISIPDSVTSIGDNAFMSCTNLTNLTIPEGVTSIGHCAFGYCKNLESITIPDGVTHISTYAFSDCSKLNSISLPNSITSMGYMVFDNTEYYNDVNNWENGVLYIDNYLIKANSTLSGIYYIKDNTLLISASAFSKCSGLTNIIIPDSVKGFVGDFTFDGCSNLTSITIPEGTSNIGCAAFRNCRNLTSINIPDSVNNIESEAFSNCNSLTSITIPEGTPNIGFAVFRGCGNLTSINIPGSVNNIGGDAFRNCNSLTSINIPDSVTYIESWAFSDCFSLTDVYYGGTEEEWKSIEIVEYYNEDLTNATIHFAEEETEYVTGDADGDGEISVKDAISIRRFIVGSYGTEIYNEAADVNKDGEVNVKDVIMIRRFIAGGYGVEL